MDLNPIRAEIAAMPEKSAHTSVMKRCVAARSTGRTQEVVGKQPRRLEQFAGNTRQPMPQGLPYRLTDYLVLVDWTGRQIREDKCGSIDKGLPEMLARLEKDEDDWVYITQYFESSFKTLVGSVHKLRKACEVLGYKRMPGRAACEWLF